MSVQRWSTCFASLAFTVLVPRHRAAAPMALSSGPPRPSAIGSSAWRSTAGAAGASTGALRGLPPFRLLCGLGGGCCGGGWACRPCEGGAAAGSAPCAAPQMGTRAASSASSSVSVSGGSSHIQHLPLGCATEGGAGTAAAAGSEESGRGRA
eukprot:3326603-Lingulodinium_polyedra.AAC.2